jgi:hypothetical protein
MSYAPILALVYRVNFPIYRIQMHNYYIQQYNFNQVFHTFQCMRTATVAIGNYYMSVMYFKSQAGIA